MCKKSYMKKKELAVRKEGAFRRKTGGRSGAPSGIGVTFVRKS